MADMPLPKDPTTQRVLEIEADAWWEELNLSQKIQAHQALQPPTTAAAPAPAPELRSTVDTRHMAFELAHQVMTSASLASKLATEMVIQNAYPEQQNPDVLRVHKHCYDDQQSELERLKAERARLTEVLQAQFPDAKEWPIEMAVHLLELQVQP